MKTTLKLTLLTWVGIYPLITLILWLFGENLSHVTLPLRTLFLTLILVPLMTLLVMPFLRKIFTHWLTPATKPEKTKISDQQQNMTKQHITS